MAKAIFVKSSLLLIMLTGTAAGLLLYSQTLSLLGRFFDIRYAWISVPMLFGISVFVARTGGRTLTKDLVETRTFGDMSLIILFRFFIGGFIGCYIAFAIIGTLTMGLYLIIRTFFLS